MTSIPTTQAAQQLDALVDAALAGDDIVLNRNGRTVRLVPWPIEIAHGRAQFGSARGQITIARDFDAPLEDFKEYMDPETGG